VLSCPASEPDTSNGRWSPPDRALLASTWRPLVHVSGCPSPSAASPRRHGLPSPAFASRGHFGLLVSDRHAHRWRSPSIFAIHFLGPRPASTKGSIQLPSDSSTGSPACQGSRRTANLPAPRF
jgi:hypothetical protein